VASLRHEVERETSRCRCWRWHPPHDVDADQDPGPRRPGSCARGWGGRRPAGGELRRHRGLGGIAAAAPPTTTRSSRRPTIEECAHACFAPGRMPPSLPPERPRPPGRRDIVHGEPPERPRRPTRTLPGGPGPRRRARPPVPTIDPPAPGRHGRPGSRLTGTPKAQNPRMFTTMAVRMCPRPRRIPPPPPGGRRRPGTTPAMGTSCTASPTTGSVPVYVPTSAPGKPRKIAPHTAMKPRPETRRGRRRPAGRGRDRPPHGVPTRTAAAGGHPERNHEGQRGQVQRDLMRGDLHAPSGP
jgi:hypothetical protein